MTMRRLATQLEALDSARFTLLIGLVAGSIEGVPRLFLGGASPIQSRPITWIMIGTVEVIWWIAALLLWWIAVRRRRSSLWAIAAQMTAGLFLGEVLAGVISLVGASIDTRGEFASLIAQAPLKFLTGNLTLPV